MENRALIRKSLLAVCAFGMTLVACSENLIPEAKRAFEVPFKGEGKMSLVYVPAFFPKNTEGVVVSGEVKYTDVVRGDKNWFDARIMTDFITSECKKANCVRLPVKDDFWFGTSPYQNDGGKAYRAAVDKIVRLVANRGAYVVLDLHRFRAPKAEHVAFWKDAAARYANHPAVLFDLFNEPHGISWEIWRNGGFVGEAGKRDESAFLSDEEKKKNQGFESVGLQALVEAVRAAGAKNVVIAGGLGWANDLTGIESAAIEKGEAKSYRLADADGNGIMYAWHTYHWHKGWGRILPVAEKHPIFIGEVGACPKGIMNFIPDSQQEDPYTFVPDMLGFIQRYRINWTGWCLHPKAAPCLIKSWNYDPTPYWGEFAKHALAGEKFEFTRQR